MESLRDDLRHLTAKYHEKQWLAFVNPENAKTLEEAGRKVQLADMVSEVESIDAEILELFTSNAQKWKLAMGVSAAILLLCLVIPYLGRILALLALPVPVFAYRCHRERNAVYGKIVVKCNEIDKRHEQMTSPGENWSKIGEMAISARLDTIEKTLGSVVEKLEATKAASSSPRKTPRKKTASAGS